MDRFLEKEFGFPIIKSEQLNGYDNINYRISTAEESFIYKTYKYSDSIYDVLIAENETLLFLSNELNTQVPSPIPFKDNSYVKTATIDHEKKVCRVLSFLDGEFLGNVEHTNKLFESLGSFLANMDLKLGALKNYTLQARQWE